MNLTGDDTVWVGFFTLSLAGHTTEIYRIIIGFKSRNTTESNRFSGQGSNLDSTLGVTLTSGGLIPGPHTTHLPAMDKKISGMIIGHFPILSRPFEG